MTPNQSCRCSRVGIEPRGPVPGSSRPAWLGMAAAACRGNRRAIAATALITLVTASLSLPVTAQAAAVLLAPKGITQAADSEFRWTADRDASNYLLELHAATGGVVDKAWLRSREIECGNGGTCVFKGLSVPLGAFRYRVRSFFGSTKGDWSPFLPFERRVETATADPQPIDEIEPGAGIVDVAAPPPSPTTSLEAVLLAPKGITQAADTEFRWTADRNASNYLLELHAATGGIIEKAWLHSREIACADGGTCVFKGLSVPLGAFRYRVRSFFGSTKGDWSSFLSFERRVESATADPQPIDEIEPGSGIVEVAAPPPGPTTSLAVPAIPSPAANLVIHYLQPSGFQKVTGRADQDLLLVSPNQSINGKFQIDVDGFRGVYWIGASFDTQSAGWLTSPNGKRTEGVGTLVRIRTHKDAVRPFIVMGRMDLKTSNIDFGDFAQLGGNTSAGKWQAWPDVWRCRIIAEPLFGWRDYKGGSFSQYVSHSDFTKFETGGVRHSYAARIAVDVAYQGEYTLPSYASDKKPYRGPDGRGTAQYWDYVARAVTNAAIGSEPKPKAFFLARSSDEVTAGDYITYRFNTSGRGVWVVPVKGRPVTDHIHPGGGTYAPQVSGSTLTWRNPSGDPFVVGRINDGSKATPPTVVGSGEVGYAKRVTSRSGLEQAIASLCR